MTSPPLHKITEIYTFIADDESGEGIPAYLLGDVMFPLVGADKARVDSLREMAQRIANAEGKQLKLARFTMREELEVITPAGASH